MDLGVWGVGFEEGAHPFDVPRAPEFGVARDRNLFPRRVFKLQRLFNHSTLGSRAL